LVSILAIVLLALQVLVALVDKGFELDVLTGILGTVNRKGKNWQAEIMTELVEQHTDDSPRHAAKGDNIDNPIEAMFSIFYNPSHAQDGFSLHRRGEVCAPEVQDFLCW